MSSSISLPSISLPFTGFQHACFSLRHEGRLDEDPLSKEAVIEPGRLLKLLQKGLLYMAVEAHVNDVSTAKMTGDDGLLVARSHQHAD